jgi:hypothetical protein
MRRIIDRMLDALAGDISEIRAAARELADVLAGVA